MLIELAIVKSGFREGKGCKSLDFQLDGLVLAVLIFGLAPVWQNVANIL